MIVESNNKDSFLNIFNTLRVATGQAELLKSDIEEDCIVSHEGKDGSTKNYKLFKIKDIV
jgi:hypothetical protein